MIAPDPPMPELDIAAMVAYLSEHGYSVRKARASRAEGPLGTTLAKAPKGHEHCAEHYKVNGYRKPVCIAAAGTVRENGRDTGEPIGPQWTERDTVLRFALDMAAARPDPSQSHDRAWWDAWHEARNAALDAAQEERYAALHETREENAA